MGFVVLHMEKAHGSDSGTTAHIERFIIPKNADPTRTHLNRKLIEYPDGVKDRSAAVQRRLEEAGLTRKIGSNQVRAIPHQRVGNTRRHGTHRTGGTAGRVVRRQPQIFCRHVREGEHRGGSPALGRENTAHARHTCADSQGERKRKKREEQAKKRYRKEADRHREAVRRRYYDTAEIEVLPRYLCRSDGEIRAAKGHRRLEGSPQVHAAVLSGYTETRRRPQSGKWWICNSRKKRHGRN